MVYVAWIKLDCPSKAVIKVVLYTAPFVKLVLYMWQSRVEIEHYSVR